MEVKKLEKSQIEMSGEMSAEVFGSFWQKAIAKLSQTVKIDGFRPGRVPEDILIKKIGEGAVLDEAAELALQDAYPKIIFDKKIAAIGRPMITITKIARGNPLGWKVVTAVIPEIKLPDYKKIAKKVFDEALKDEIVVTDKELDDLINEVRRERADKDKPAELPAMSEVELPPFDNEFVKSLGQFESVADFRTKMRENLKLEKEASRKSALRFKTIESIDKESRMELPEILVENELKRGMREMQARVEEQGLNFEEYLKGIKKSLEDIKKESRGQAEQSVRYNLVLKEIAKRENISIPSEEVTKEAERLVKMYNGANLEAARMYVEDILINSKVLQFLEGDNS